MIGAEPKAKNGMKVCRSCKINLPVLEFQLRGSGRRMARCRWCRRILLAGKHPKHKTRLAKRIDPVKLRARNAVRDAVRRGKIEKPNRCNRCHKSFLRHQLMGHHHDYSRPIDVEWLCSSCHSLEHMRPTYPGQDRPMFTF